MIALLTQGLVFLGQVKAQFTEPIYTHHISDAFQPIQLEPTWILLEQKTRLSIAQIRVGDIADAIEIQRKDLPRIEPNQGYWIGMQLSADHALDDWLLYFEDPTADRGILHGYSFIEVYIQDSLGPKSVKKAGSLVPKSQRDVTSRHTLNRVTLRLAPHTQSLVWIYIHKQLLPKPFPKISLRNPYHGPIGYNHRTTLTLISAASMFAILFIIGMALFLVSKERLYACFSLYTGIQTAQAVMVLPHNPLGEWIFVEHPLLSPLIGSAIATFYVYGYIQFSLDLIDAKKHFPRLTKWLNHFAIYTIVYAWLTAIIVPLIGIEFSTVIMSGYFLFFIAGTVLFALLSLKRSPLVRFVGGTGTFFFGSYILVNIMSATGKIDPALNLHVLLLIALAPAVMGVFAMVFRFQQSEADKAETRRLAELDIVKTRLYTNITHEFRTPLTVIQGLSDKILEKPEQWLNDGLKTIKRNSQHLLRLVNQLLALAKLESGQLRLKTFQVDIVSFTRYLVEAYQSYADMREVSLAYALTVERLEVKIDVDRYSDIVSNLIANALKFTEPGGQVILSLELEAPHFLLKVSDNGQGISATALPFIFDRFYQADNSDIRTNEGTGIGLALSKELCELMGGHIYVKSTEGEGSTFSLKLPLHPPYLSGEVIPYKALEDSDSSTEADTLPERSPRASLASETLPSLLIVEDNLDIVKYLRFCLADDFQIIHAKDGEVGIELAQEKCPDLIISDVMMPKKNGYEVCDTLKKDIRTNHIPIIMLTARADTDSRLTGLDKGADAYLTKPFNEKELRIRIDKLLELRRSLRKHYTQSDDEKNPEFLGPAPQDAFIQRVKKSVYAQLDNPKLNVNSLCKALNLSRTPLHNKIKALTGMSTTEFIRHIRIGEAAKLLETSELNISEIAYKCGFRTPNYFSRVFRDRYGRTPKQYREG